MLSGRTNNYPESRRGLGHVTLQFLAVRSAILATAWLLVCNGVRMSHCIKGYLTWLDLTCTSFHPTKLNNLTTEDHLFLVILFVQCIRFLISLICFIVWLHVIICILYCVLFSFYLFAFSWFYVYLLYNMYVCFILINDIRITNVALGSTLIFLGVITKLHV